MKGCGREGDSKSVKRKIEKRMEGRVVSRER